MERSLATPVPSRTSDVGLMQSLLYFSIGFMTLPPNIFAPTAVQFTIVCHRTNTSSQLNGCNCVGLRGLSKILSNMSLPLSHLRDSASTKLAVGRAKRMNSSVGVTCLRSRCLGTARMLKECGHETCIECWKKKNMIGTTQTHFAQLCDTRIVSLSMGGVTYSGQVPLRPISFSTQASLTQAKPCSGQGLSTI